MLQLKQKFFLILIIVAIIALSGCISQNTTGDNSNSSKSSTGNSTAHNASNPASGAKYEASGVCYHVVDGDTIDVEGVGRIRLVGINTPERGESGYQNATDFVKSMVLGKKVSLDIDDSKHYDKYNRTLAVVYINNMNLNAELLKRGYAEVMYIPPSEFNPYSWT